MSRKRILVVDNRDSFVYNIIEYLRRIDSVDISVVKDDGDLSMCDFVDVSNFDGIVLSPGAGVPDEYDIMKRLLQDPDITLPMLGVCLGLQAMVLADGGRLKQLPVPKHGHSSKLSIVHPKHDIFAGVSDGTLVGRYHSWVVDEDCLPSDWRILAYDEDGNVMAAACDVKKRVGVQFHPESIMTTSGESMIREWVKSL